MDTQEQQGSIELEAALNMDSQKDIRSNDHPNCGDDFAPKARKPYTITKQRERWSDEEHKRFVEALKLHGRAWRRIEERVGSKTAVQIRSHAQKFFSKVVRDLNAGDAEDTILLTEIPPARPKRKPVHPYPRKEKSPVKAVFLALEKPEKSVLANALESPKSPFSPMGSDLSCGRDSGLPSSDHDREDEQSNLHLGPELSTQALPSLPSESSRKCLKLFGKTFFVSQPFLFPVPVRVIPLEPAETKVNCSDHKEQSSTAASGKGFRPYKRCLGEQDQESREKRNKLCV